MVVSSDPTGGHRNLSGGDPIQKEKEKEKKENTKEWKLCKGCLYYSSRLRSNGRDPPCVGTQIPIHQVPASILQNYKMVASREGNLSYFKYTCVGYSIFLHGEDSATKQEDKLTSLPVCAGYELLLGKKSLTSSQVPTRKHQKNYKEDLYFVRSRRTTSNRLARENFWGRMARYGSSAFLPFGGSDQKLTGKASGKCFSLKKGDGILLSERKKKIYLLTRNADVVASGVARNLLGLGSRIKDNLDNVLYPDRRRPK